MDELNKRTENEPYGGYNPEDEYEAIGPAAAPVSSELPISSPAPVPAAEAVHAPDVKPAAAPYAPTAAPAAPQNAPVRAPGQTVPAAYPQPAYPMYPPYGMPYPGAVQQAPQAPPAPVQPTYYPGYYPYVQPYYPQQPGYPAQQYTAYPAPPAAPVQPPQIPQPAPAAVSAPSPAAQAEPLPDIRDNRPKNPPTSTGTKVFLIVLIALLVAMIVGFAIYISNISKDASGVKDSGNDIIENLKEYYEELYKGYNKNGGEDDSDDINDIINEQDTKQKIEEFDVEIKLVEDNGDTQKRSDDNPDTVGKADPNAKGVTLEALPKDKDNAKYTTQSAYESVGNSVVTVQLFADEITEEETDIVGQGTGTIISSDGYIVTNAHVIGNSRRYAVNIVMNSGDSYQAKVVGYDTWTDLAVLKIDAKGLTPAVFGDSDLIEIGQDVIAIGSPGGEKFQNSLTKGIVSAVDRELSINKYVRYIQSDAAISPGNSGGPLCNIYGQVVGINTAKNIGNYEAMTFSIPSSTVKKVVDELLHYGYVRGRTRIGLTGTEVSEEEQYYYGLPAGVIISEIDKNGSLAGTDIKEGDIITAIDGEEVSTFQDIYAILNKHKPGDKVKVSVYRITEE